MTDMSGLAPATETDLSAESRLNDINRRLDSLEEAVASLMEDDVEDVELDDDLDDSAGGGIVPSNADVPEEASAEQVAY